MKNIIKKLMCVVLLLGATYAYGQKTAFENKVVEIKAKYLIKLGMSATEAQKITKNNDWLYPTALNEQAKKHSLKHGSAATTALLLEMGKEFKQAEKLKTTTDFNKEKKAQEQETKAKKEREAEEAKKKALQDEKSTALYKIKEQTKEDFIKWVKRGEFEKKADYEERMLNKEAMLNMIFSGNVYAHRIPREVILLNFDVDSELYTIAYPNDYKVPKTKATIKVSPEVAQRMKYDERDFEVDEKSIVVQDGNIFSSKVRFNNVVYNLSFQDSSIDIEKISISTNELGLSEYFPENKNVKLQKGVRNNMGRIAIEIDCEKIPSDGKLVIPYGIQEIDHFFLDKCKTLLTSVTIPSSFESIDGFDGCENLTSVAIPSSVKSIGIKAFYGCNSLTSIVIPSSVSSIGEDAFNNCSSLTSITILSETPPSIKHFDSGLPLILGNFHLGLERTAIYVPAGSVEAYKNARGWEDYARIIKPIQ